MSIRIVGGVFGGRGPWAGSPPLEAKPRVVPSKMSQAAGSSPAAALVEKAGKRYDAARMRAQKVVDRYPEIVGLLGLDTADQAVEEAGQALDRAEEALMEARQ